MFLPLTLIACAAAPTSRKAKTAKTVDKSRQFILADTKHGLLKFFHFLLSFFLVPPKCCCLRELFRSTEVGSLLLPVLSIGRPRALLFLLLMEEEEEENVLSLLLSFLSLPRNLR